MPKPLNREDENLRRLLKMPPKPFTPKAKPKPSRGTSKATSSKADGKKA